MEIMKVKPGIFGMGMIDTCQSRYLNLSGLKYLLFLLSLHFVPS